jgi:glutathione synthase/RimK-type ligase-like ATP-grasp enzyme
MEKELIKYAKKLSWTPHFKQDIRDYLRKYKHKNYVPESHHRNKFIVQQFIPDLCNDWKIYLFGEKCYVFYRPIFKHRKFKASGGGYENYFYGNNAKVPEGLLDFAKESFELFNVPNASFDIAFDGRNFFLMEFQFVYFGTAGILYSKEYFIKKNGIWIAMENNYSQEQCYADSIIEFLIKNNFAPIN